MDPHVLIRDGNLEQWMKDSSIYPLIRQPKLATTSKKTVLLTGCTGYLGKHILLELLNSQECCLVYCHVRASGNPRERLLSIMRSTFVGSLATLDSWFEKNIRIVEGDLSKPLVGLERATFDHLASTVDVIIHNGAVVNQIRSYKVLQTENVESTKDMLRLALQGRPKFFHFVSTMGVVFCCNDGGTIDERIFPTAEQVGNWYQDGSGYRCTKWVSEQLVIQAIKRGYIQGAISRPGLIGPHSVTGEGNKEDWFNLLLSAILEIGLLPTSSFFTSSKLHLIPVDYVAKGVAGVSLRGSTDNDLMPGAVFPVYHYWYSHNPIIISQVTEYLKTLMPLTEIDYQDFKEILANSRDKGSVAIAKTSTILSFVSSSGDSSMKEFFEKSYSISDKHTREVPRKMASLQDALTNVRCLQDFSLPDEQPTIEPEPTSIVYEVSFDTNFADRTAFITGSGRYNEEATICSRLNVILEEGEQYAGMLYTWRCLSRAVPAIKNNEQANRMEIYEKTIEVLGPEVEKAKEFLRFMQKAATSFTDEVKTLSHPERRRDFISEYYLLTLARLVNMFSTLDALKNMKACINNDLACYRRAESILRRGAMDAFAIEESQNLSLFFATNNSITNMIKKNLEEVPGFEEVLVETINLCCTHYEAQMYIVPEEKYQLLKAIGYGMVLLDGNVVNINKLKKLNIPRIDRIFKSMPVAPLYGDVQIKLPLLVKGLPHHDSSRWNCTSESLDDKLSISITDKLDQIRQEHVQIMSRLARYNNEIITSSQFTQNDHTSREMYEMAVKAVQLLTSWSTSVMEMYSWKLLHPTNHYDNKECPADAEDYEKATRYNYTSDEKYALVEVIAMIKGLALLMQKMEKHFSQAIRRHIYVRMQEFVQVGIRDSIRHTAKKKKHKPKTILLGLRDVCVDWLNGEPRDDPATRGDKDPKGGFKVDVPRKAVRPSSTQLYMMRTMLESLISDKTGAEKKALKVELKDSSIPEFESFHRASFYYAKLLDLSSTLHDCSCLPGLWFREFFLELTMGERIQFPIEMSLPWILADHILESKEAHMMEYILYPLDLYSDSGHYALHHFKKQFLYDEVEAEVNLCFDQMVYKLSEQIFSHFKQLAASIYLDKRFRAESTAKLPYPNPNRYETILKQRHVQLLGRSIDLNRLLAQRLGASMLKAMDTVIHKFESSDLTAVVELETLMEINRLTHSLLMEHVTLDPFPVMLNEANQAINSPHGRITLHIFWELHYDFLPNFCYNSTTDRFVRSKLPHDTQEREHHPKGPGTTTMLYGTKHLREAYQSALSMYENFVGPEHFATMSRLLGYQGTSMVIQQLLNIMNSSIHNTVNPYIQALGHGMPQKCKLPLYDYGSKGVLGFYYAQLTPVIQYGELRTEVFQVFKEIGNTVLFCLLLEKSMSQEEIIDTLEGSPFLGTYPKPFIKEEESAEMVKQKLEQQYATIQLQPLISSKGSTPQKFISEESVLLTKERLCVGLTLFEGVMRRIKSYITDPVWTGPLPSNGVMNVDECQEFHRIWSAIQFVYCIPLPTGQLTVEECFGEGLHWAGCTFIVLLGQQKRFEALDFCYHLMRVHEVDRQGDIVSGVNVKKMVERIKAFYQLNNQIFATLNKCLTTSDIIGQQAREYQPPIYQPSSSV